MADSISATELIAGSLPPRRSADKPHSAPIPPYANQDLESVALTTSNLPNVSGGGNTSQDSSGAGTIFRITTNGAFTLLYSFTGGSDGDTPMAALVQDATGNFYGTTEYGGTGGYGCVFKVTPGGIETNLYSFDYTVVGGTFVFTDGASPTASLVRWSDGSFYGTTRSGGANLLGTVFNMAAGGNFTTIYSFNSASGGASSHFPGPQLNRGTNGLLYGTTFSGGISNKGTLFQMTPAGTLTTLYAFKGNDGANPVGGMVQGTDGMFYGTTCYGGVYTAQDPSGNGYGTIFQMTPAGILTNLYSFSGTRDGGIPAGALIQGADGSFYGTTATTFFNLGYSTPPFISSQPANQTNVPGATVSFAVVAGGTPPLVYQWQLDGTNLPGADGSSLILTNVQFTQAGTYAVVVSNAAGSVTSSNANLSVTVNPPVITTPPASQTVNHGSNAVFSVTATGTPPLGYQWRINTTNLPGATASSLVLTNVQLADNGAYTVVVSNAAGAVTSAKAVLNVSGVPPALTAQPFSQSAVTGHGVTFTAGATGSLPLSFQWQFNSASMAGQTNSSLTMTNLQWLQAGNYRVVISNLWGLVVSSNAYLTIPASSAALTALPLYSFTNGADGGNPSDGLVQGTDGNLYGTTPNGGGTNSFGTVFVVTTNGILTVLHTFTGGADGGAPQSGLMQANDGNFYGTTLNGGVTIISGSVTNAARGTVYRINTNGMLTTLYSFTGPTDGASPSAGLIQATDGYLYGMTSTGGRSGGGTMFKITTNGVLSVIHSFTGGYDGGNATARLIQGMDGSFYGTTPSGGSTGAGTLFRMTKYLAFTVLHSFSYAIDGAYPRAGLVQGPDGNLYGATYYGGNGGAGAGALIRVSTNGLFKSLYTFTGGNDGGYPLASMILASDGGLYGTTTGGGPNGAGTVFRLTTNGVLTTVAVFSGGADGYSPAGSLLQANNGVFYGTTVSGGAGNSGDVYALGVLAPPVIDIPPANLTGVAGDNLDLSVHETTRGPFVYQWQLNGLDLGGATNAVLGIVNLSALETGAYTVIVRNAAGVVTSAVARVTIDPGIPSIAFPLYSFTNGIDGANPSAGLIQGADGNFYGTTHNGVGSSNAGTVFQISPTGALNTLHAFTGGADGGNPAGGLVQGSNGELYGTTSVGGGTNQAGTVFRMTTNGVLTTLYAFNRAGDGALPLAGLVSGSDGSLYGTTAAGGGTNNAGTIFRISTSGTLTTLYTFNGTNDGSIPNAALIQDAQGILYGTTLSGGLYSSGTFFTVTTNGGLTTLYSFTGGDDGGHPSGEVAQDAEGNFYGTTESGAYGYGTVFRITPGGVFATLYSFTGGDDGSTPFGGLRMGNDGKFYGTTRAGGAYSSGTAFRVTTNGLLATICVFTGKADGGAPTAALLQASDGNFYGTTSSKGKGWGTIFVLQPLPPPALTAEPSSHAVAAGDFVELTVGVGGPGPFTYQWQLNGTNLADATSQVLHLNGLATNQAGFYSVVVSDAAGSLTSSVATVTVRAPQSPWMTTVLHGFGYNDGAYPQSGVVQGIDGAFYGTSLYGGAIGSGTIYRITTNGGFSTLHSFNGGSDGGYPYAGLVQGTDGKLYGTTTSGGGTNQAGTVFRISTNGLFSVLHSFNSTEGSYASARLVQGPDGNFYGTTSYGSTNYGGTIYRMTTNGVLTTLYAFTGGADGASPSSLVIAGDGNFYGTTSQGGSGFGTVFQLATNGALSSLYEFNGGGDGANPQAGLAQGSDGALYGSTQNGGANSLGTLFRVTTGGDLTTLYAFTGGNDGASPRAALVPGSDGDLYGTTSTGGTNSNGTVFRITIEGDLSPLHVFSGVSDGSTPVGSVLLAKDGKLYGTTQISGTNGWGTVFRLTNPNVQPGGSLLLRNPVWAGQTFRLSFPTQTGMTYILEFKDALTNSSWMTNQSVPGTGGTIILTDPNASAPSRYYRVRTP